MFGRKLNSVLLFWIQVIYNICKSVLIFEFIGQLDKWRFPRIYSVSLLLDPVYYLDSNLRVRNLCFPFYCYLWRHKTATGCPNFYNACRKFPEKGPPNFVILDEFCLGKLQKEEETGSRDTLYVTNALYVTNNTRIHIPTLLSGVWTKLARHVDGGMAAVARMETPRTRHVDKSAADDPSVSQSRRRPLLTTRAY